MATFFLYIDMNLELYYFRQCPFCAMVQSKIKELNLTEYITLKDIHASNEIREFHIQTTGRGSVPCLYIDGNPMFESRDIMNWLTSNKEIIIKG